MKRKLLVDFAFIVPKYLLNKHSGSGWFAMMVMWRHPDEVHGINYYRDRDVLIQENAPRVIVCDVTAIFVWPFANMV